MRVNSDAMAVHDSLGRCRVDRSLKAGNGKIIIANVDGELLIRKLEMNEDKGKLVASKK